MPSTARDWMLTISAEKHTRQDVEELLDILGAYIFQQEEGGKSDYPHFQAFLQLQTPVHMGVCVQLVVAGLVTMIFRV